MSRIKGNDTKPEIMVRKWLWSKGYRYRLHYKKLPGKPDIVFPGKKKAIFIHGCFWHRHKCQLFKWPATNIEFWKGKINATVERDSRSQDALVDLGWNILTIWECETKANRIEDLRARILMFLDKH
jgi:DNA mismatch endonuclease (patch repair protein)